MPHFGSPILADPVLAPSQLEFRLGLARRRTAAYPLDSMDFIMMDLERPDLCTRHAHWCTGDLTGRLLEFLSCAEGIDGRHDPRLPDLFERILRTQRACGSFGRYAMSAHTTEPPEVSNSCGMERLFSGLLRYYDATSDWRAVEAATRLAELMLPRKDALVAMIRDSAANPLETWVTEHMARLYRITRDERHLDFCAAIGDAIHTCMNSHSHGFMSAMRGLQLMALFSGDASWNEKPERFRRLIIDEGYEGPDGCIAEMFPRNFRNEGCSIADWLMMNLNAAAIGNDASAYDRAENALLNALYLCQFVTGGFGHRELRPWGYATTGEEAWWCCTEHAGMALTEVARHAVTFDGLTLRINFLVSGRYTIRLTGAPDIEVSIATSYPSRADSIVTVRNLPDDAEVALRLPPSIVDPALARTVGRDGVRLHLTGKIGHWVEEVPDGVLLRYGPLVLAPSIYYWNTEREEVDSSVPDGYVPRSQPPGLPHLCVADLVDADTGLIAFEPKPLSEWSYFDEGPGARCAVEGASAMVPVRFDGGEERTLRFTPLCANMSTLVYLDTPILFPGIC